MSLHPFLNAQRQLRNGWWALLFFFVLAALLFPLLFLARRDGGQVPAWQQALVVALASLICQGLRRRPQAEVFGPFDGRWPRQFFAGTALGALLMLAPALFLGLFCGVRWQWNSAGIAGWMSTLLPIAGAVVAEELIFRGFLFQRLLDGLGTWLAQGILAAYFVLIHFGTLGAAGAQKQLAGLNIFLASILFGLAYLRTRSLALPLGIHCAANVTQGSILGFGVSGNEAGGLWRPIVGDVSNWLTGGAFGLEASLPGLVCVIAALFGLYRWRQDGGRFSRNAPSPSAMSSVLQRSSM